MIERNDFTNYLVFFDQFKSNTLLLEQLEKFNPAFHDFILEDRQKYMMRYLYTVIYECYTTDFSTMNSEPRNEIREKLKEKEQDGEFSGNIFADPDSLAKGISDSLPRKEEDLDRKNPLESASSMQGINTKPNEKEKEEGKATEWDIDDKLLIFS